MHILLNGRKTEIAESNLFSLKERLYPNNKVQEVVSIINGYQTGEDVWLKEKDEVTFIPKGVMPSKEELERMMCARHTPRVHEKVKKAYVAIAGLGGLGSNIAVALARTGVGHLHLIDFDMVEPSNLNRQQYKIKHLGMYKADALKSEIGEINPFIEVQIDKVKVEESNMKDLFQQDTIICEAFDNPDAKAMLVNFILTEYPEKKMVAASGMAGFDSCNRIITRRITRNFYLCGDGDLAASQGNGLMAPRVTVCAGHQANMILRLILGETEV